jgi:uncharacterized membrane protein
LPEPDARRLLTTAFCRDVVVALEPALREALGDALERALARLQAR